LPSFTIAVDKNNIEKRLDWLQGALGPKTKSDRSNSTITTQFAQGTTVFDCGTREQKGNLSISHSLTTLKDALDLISKIRITFPEMVFKSKFMNQFKKSAQGYERVSCRGFLSMSKASVVGQDVEFFLTNSPPEEDIVIAEDGVDRNQRQVVFTRSWSDKQSFVKEVLEPWLVSERVKLLGRIGEVHVPFFTGAPFQVLSESRLRWIGLPVPSLIYSQVWPSPNTQEYPNENWAIVQETKTYADIRHAFVFLFERPWEQIRYNCLFCLPDKRGRIVRVSIEPSEKEYDLIVECETAVPLALKVSCFKGSEVTNIFNTDHPMLERFPVDYIPTQIKAELLSPKLVDRLIHLTTTGIVTTSIETVPSVAITTEIRLPVKNQVLADSKVMIGAYARFFIMENTLRAVVKEKFVEAFGAQWTHNLAPILLAGKPLSEKTRIEQVLQSAPDKILEHVYYRDLSSIIDKFWSLFEGLFHDRQRTLLKLTELEGLRNDIAHNRVLAEHDVRRIEVYYMDLLSGIR
jgi:hypothetical protein